MPEAGGDSTAARTRTRYVIRGRVQGVGFRAWVVRRATALDLCGTVRNALDGSVEIEVAGRVDAIARFRDILSRGPELAIVRRISEEAITSSDLPAGFRIIA